MFEIILNNFWCQIVQTIRLLVLMWYITRLSKVFGFSKITWLSKVIGLSKVVGLSNLIGLSMVIGLSKVIGLELSNSGQHQHKSPERDGRVLNGRPLLHTPNAKDVMTTLRTICTNLFFTFTFSLDDLDWDVNSFGIKLKFPSYFFKPKQISFWYIKCIVSKKSRGEVGRGLGRGQLGSIPPILVSFLAIPPKSHQMKY